MIAGHLPGSPTSIKHPHFVQQGVITPRNPAPNPQLQTQAPIRHLCKKSFPFQTRRTEPDELWLPHISLQVEVCLSIFSLRSH